MNNCKPSVPLARLHKLCRCIIIWYVEPEAMRNSSFGTFSETKRVSTNKICTFTVRVIQGIEKMRGGWGEDVLDVLLECVD